MRRRYHYNNISPRSYATRSIGDEESRQSDCAVERKAARGYIPAAQGGSHQSEAMPS